MTPEQSLELLRIGVGLLALWALYFFAWSDYKVDAFRHRLFVLRGEFFDYAAESGLPFDHPAYALFRDRINRMIRWADLHTALHFFLFLLFMRRDAAQVPHPHKDWMAAVETVENDAIQEQLRNFENRLAAIMVRRLFISPLGVPFLFVVLSYVVFSRLVTETRTQLRKRLDDFMRAGGAEQAFEQFSANVPGLENLETQILLEEQCGNALAA